MDGGAAYCSTGLSVMVAMLSWDASEIQAVLKMLVPKVSLPSSQLQVTFLEVISQNSWCVPFPSFHLCPGCGRSGLRCFPFVHLTTVNLKDPGLLISPQTTVCVCQAPNSESPECWSWSFPHDWSWKWLFWGKTGWREGWVSSSVTTLAVIGQVGCKSVS